MVSPPWGIWLPGSAFIVVGLVVIWCSFKLSRKYRVLPMDGCGRCGYPIRGLRSVIYPECGAHRAEVGVFRPKPQVSFGHGVILLVGMVLVGIGLAPLFWPVIMVIMILIATFIQAAS